MVIVVGWCVDGCTVFEVGWWRAVVGVFMVFVGFVVEIISSIMAVGVTLLVVIGWW